MTIKKDFDIPPLPSQQTVSPNEEHQEHINYTNRDYIVGLDFGSTSSAFSFACADFGAEIKNHSDIIYFVEKWSKKYNTPSCKIPSTVYLNCNKKPTKKIGMEALITSNRRNADGILLRNFKPLLGRSYDPRVDERVMKNMTQRDISNATAIFFKRFYKMGVSEMNRVTSHFIRRSTIISRVISAPPTWPRKKRDALKEAIMQANIVPKESFDREFMFTSDTQAAALHCETLFDSFQMNMGRSFVVLDAGGSTTKLSVFTIAKSDEPESKPVMIELIPSSQVRCGGAHLDDVFMRLVVEKFEDCEIRINKKQIDCFVKYFVDNIKHNFTSQEKEEEEEVIKIPVPFSIGLSDEFFDKKGLIKDGCLIVTKEEMENTVFNPTVNLILDHLEKRLSKLPENCRSLDDLLLVGGLGESTYLYKKIVQKLETINFRIGSIRQPRDGRLAVSKGAVSYGLRPRLIPTDFVRYIYGLQISNAPKNGVCFQKEEAASSSNRTAQIGTFYCNVKTEKLQFEKYEVFYSSVIVQHPGILKIAFYPLGRESSSSVDADSEFACEATIDTSKFVKEFTDVEFQIRIETKATYIELCVIYKNTVISRNTVRCEQEMLLKYTPNEKKIIKRKRSILDHLKKIRR